MRAQDKTMTVIPKAFRVRLNRAAHDQALRHETQLRERWTAELSEAMQRKSTYEQLQNLIGRFEGVSATAEERCARSD